MGATLDSTIAAMFLAAPGFAELFVCGIIVLIPLLIVGIILTVVRRSRGGVTLENTGVVQDIHASLKRMEERIEALETILLGRTKER